MMMRMVFIIMQMSMVVSDRFMNVRVTMILLHDHMSGANASSSGVFYEAFCGDAAKYEAQLTLHEAALRAMKRSLTASCFFAQIWAKKMVGVLAVVRKRSLPSKKLETTAKY